MDEPISRPNRVAGETWFASASFLLCCCRCGGRGGLLLTWPKSLEFGDWNWKTAQTNKIWKQIKKERNTNKFQRSKISKKHRSQNMDLVRNIYQCLTQGYWSFLCFLSSSWILSPLPWQQRMPVFFDGLSLKSYCLMLNLSWDMCPKMRVIFGYFPQSFDSRALFLDNNLP